MNVLGAICNGLKEPLEPSIHGSAKSQHNTASTQHFVRQFFLSKSICQFSREVLRGYCLIKILQKIPKICFLFYF